MTHDPAAELLDLPEPHPGFKRQWVRCRECGRVFFVTYQPYSLSSPVRSLPCGHGLTQRWAEIVENITPHEAALELWNTLRRDERLAAHARLTHRVRGSDLWDERAAEQAAYYGTTPERLTRAMDQRADAQAQAETTLET